MHCTGKLPVIQQSCHDPDLSLYSSTLIADVFRLYNDFMQLKVRKAAFSDTEALLELLEDTRKFKLSLGDDAWGDYPFTKEDVVLRLKSDGCFLAELNNHIAGSISLIWEDEYNWGEDGKDKKAGYIHGLMVGAKFRGNDLGKQMIMWAIRQVKDKGRPYVRLDCRSVNKRLCKYYESLGFKLFKINNNTAFYQIAV